MPLVHQETGGSSTGTVRDGGRGGGGGGCVRGTVADARQCHRYSKRWEMGAEGGGEGLYHRYSKR